MAKVERLCAVPAEVMTVSGPVVAPVGTIARIKVAERTVKFAALPLKRTAVVPVKFAPVSRTLLPTMADVGVKLVMRGATTNLVALAAVPAMVVTAMNPDVELFGTVIVI